jgi:hypothetical protein
MVAEVKFQLSRVGCKNSDRLLLAVCQPNLIVNIPVLFAGDCHHYISFLGSAADATDYRTCVLFLRKLNDLHAEYALPP